MAAKRSYSLLIRLFCPSQEKVHSTTHRRGRSPNFLCAKESSSGSIATPSLSHSLTNLLITSSGASFGGWRTISAGPRIRPSLAFLGDRDRDEPGYHPR